MLKAIYKWSVRFVMLAWWLLLALFVIKFYLDNTATVDVSFMRWTLSDVEVSRLAFGLLGGGMALALLILLPWVLMLRFKLKRLERSLSRTQTALQTVAKT